MSVLMGFTRNQIIAGLCKGNYSRKLTSDGKFDRKKYLDYRKTIENTFDSLDQFYSRFSGASVSVDNLKGEFLSLRDDYNQTSSFVQGNVLRISREDRFHGYGPVRYDIEFSSYVALYISRPWGQTCFRAEAYADGKLSPRAFTLFHLSQCIGFRSFSLDREEMTDDGLDLAQDVAGSRLLVELLEESRKTGFILPVDVNTILHSGNRTKYDVISQRGRLKGIPKSVNRYPLAVGYAMKRALAVVGRDGRARFEGRNAMNIIRILDEYRGRFQRYFGETFRSLTTILDFAIALHLYGDIDPRVSTLYLGLCREKGIIADLSIRNEQTMLEAVFRISPPKTRNRKMKIAEPFRILAQKISGYELLETEKEMADEGCRQHNCVQTYIRAVNAGKCAIFTHVNAKGKRFTIEVGYDDGEYRCFQFKGVCNSDSPTDKMKFQKILEEVNEDIGVKRDRRLHSAYESGESHEIQDTDDIPF